MAGQLMFFQATTGLLLIACALYVAALGVVLYHRPRYRRGGRS